MKSSLLSLLSLLSLSAALLPASALSQATGEDPTKGLYIKQNLGVTLPLDLPFKDETGKDVNLGDFFKERPVILVPVFYNCQSSCLLIKEGLLKTLNSQKHLVAGKDFDVVVVSINHKETPELAAGMKDAYLANYHFKGTEDGWHLLTGSKESIFSLTQAVGFGFKFEEDKDPETGEISDRIMHPSTLILLTPEGVTSLYLTGVKYPAEILRRGILDAKANKVGVKTEEILFGCFMYDPSTGKYRLVVENALKVTGIATVLILFTSIAVMGMKNRRTALHKEDLEGGTRPAA